MTILHPSQGEGIAEQTSDMRYRLVGCDVEGWWFTL